MMTWVTTIWTVGISATPSSVTPGPGTTAPAPSMSLTCASTSSRWAQGGWPQGSNASGPGGGTQAECFPSACQVSVYLQNWSHVLSYVSKAESTPEIAEVKEELSAPQTLIQEP